MDFKHFLWWLLLVPGPLLLYILCREVYDGLRGERRWRELKAASDKVFRTYDYLGEDFLTRASYRSRKRCLPEQERAMTILFECGVEIHREIGECELPFWRKPRLHS